MVTRRKTKPADDTKDAETAKPERKAPRRRAAASPARQASSEPTPPAPKPAEAPIAEKGPRAEDQVWPAAADREQRIRERAYALWEGEGGEHGRHSDHWGEAERQIDEEDGSTANEVTGRSRGAY